MSTITWMHVVRAQWLLLWLSLRARYLLMSVGTIAVFMHVLGPQLQAAFQMDIVVSPAWAIVFAVFGLAWAWAVWEGEPPHRRWHHWAAPVDCTLHDYARVAAGLLWLLPCVILVLVIDLLAGVVGGNAFSVLSRPHPLYWISLFIAGAIGYLFMSVLTIAMKRAVEVAVLLIVGEKMLETMLESGRDVRSVTLAGYLDSILHGRLGLMEAVAGMSFPAQQVSHNGIWSAVANWLTAVAIWSGSVIVLVLLSGVANRGRVAGERS